MFTTTEDCTEKKFFLLCQSNIKTSEFDQSLMGNFIIWLKVCLYRVKKIKYFTHFFPCKQYLIKEEKV